MVGDRTVTRVVGVPGRTGKDTVVIPVSMVDGSLE